MTPVPIDPDLQEAIAALGRQVFERDTSLESYERQPYLGEFPGVEPPLDSWVVVTRLAPGIRGPDVDGAVGLWGAGLPRLSPAVPFKPRRR